MERAKYLTDLSDEQWQLIEPMLPPPSTVGAPRRVSRRWVVNAILYVVRTGSPWRLLPKDFPPWRTVYGMFWTWRVAGIWGRIHNRLRDAVRQKVGRKRSAKVAIIDSQTVKTTEAGGERGYDGAKKIKGRKRHLVVDTLGLILAVVVLPANLPDQEGACYVLDRMRGLFGRL